MLSSPARLIGKRKIAGLNSRLRARTFFSAETPKPCGPAPRVCWAWVMLGLWQSMEPMESLGGHLHPRTQLGSSSGRGPPGLAHMSTQPKCWASGPRARTHHDLLGFLSGLPEPRASCERIQERQTGANTASLNFALRAEMAMSTIPTVLAACFLPVPRQ